MNRYILSEKDHPLSSDYYYEAEHTTNQKSFYLPSHSHNYYEIYIYIGGDVELVVNNHIFHVQKGDIVIIPPYCVHSLIPSSNDIPYERMYLYITETCLSSFQFNEFSLLKPILDTIKRERFHFHIDSDSDFQRITYAIDRIKESKYLDYYGKEMLNRSYLIQFFTIINSYVIKETCKETVYETSSLISQVIAYLNENFTEDITLENLCECFFTNRQSLTKLFKQYTTMTIHNYIALTRIARAKQLMYQGLSPSKAYTKCGFNDYTTFYRAFKKIEGISPQQFYMLSIDKQTNP